MKAIDNYTIEHINIPSMVLMERAALHVAEQVKKHIDMNSKILAVCGFGNNGGDGIAAARILTIEGYNVDILTVGDEHKATEQTKEQLKIARNLGISIDNNININEYTIIIDAIFGIGLSKPVTGAYEIIINAINAGDNLVFSVDIPSGLSADNAKPYNAAVRADYTITFGWIKQGLILYPGYEYAGEVIVADIGFPKMAIETVKPNYFTYDSSDLNKLPERKEHSNKGTYGKVLIIAGSTNICGACFFSAKASYRTGAGLVKIVTVTENRAILQTLLPEALLTTYNSNMELNNEIIDKIVNDIKWASVIVFGPGIGVNSYSDKLLDILIDNTKVPVIIDADGINLLANRVNKSPSFNSNCTTEAIEKLTNILPDQTILTPHLLELSRLINIPLKTIQEDLIFFADQCTYNNKLIFAIKDEKTIVTNQNKGYINTSGNNGMATGGTGDVLTGVIAGFIAQGLNQFEAATLGVYIHGLAGDMAAKVKGTYGLMASDVIEALTEVLK
jgi:NAD(P)H-hydrate epimerase